MKKLILGMFFVSGFLLTSCGDDNGPTLTITSEQNITVSIGGEFIVSGNAVDDTGISSITFTGQDNFELNEELDLSVFADKTNIPFSFGLSDLTGDAGVYKLDVLAIDEDGNSDTETIEITLQ